MFPQGFLSRARVRALDRRASAEYGLAGVVLMENAGRGAAELLLALGIHGPVVVGCGKGNNGGDGLVIARHLLNHGYRAQVWLCARPEELTADAAVNLRILHQAGLPMHICPENPDSEDLARHWARADWVVDALCGTGLSGAVRPPLAGIIAAINSCGARVLAVDIPSGLDADTGLPLGATVRAQHTVTFVAPKQGFANPAAAAWLGCLHVVDIGMPPELLDQVGSDR